MCGKWREKATTLIIIKQCKSELCDYACAKMYSWDSYFYVKRDCKLLSAVKESDGSGKERVLWAGGLGYNTSSPPV